MTASLPPNLLSLFTARPPIPYLPPADGNKKPLPPYEGLSAYVQHFEEPSTVDYSKLSGPVESREKRTERIRKEREARARARIAKELEKWDPHENSSATGDAYATLFVSRSSFETSERKLKKEFEEYGPVKRVRLVKDKDGKPRGYAFIEFEKERHMRTAYKQADGKKIDDRRVLVDVERGRTVKGWRPRRLGGGLGGSRQTGSSAGNLKSSGRNAPSDKNGQDRERYGSRDDRERDRFDGDRDRERSSHGKDRSDDSRDKDRDRDRGSKYRR